MTPIERAEKIVKEGEKASGKIGSRDFIIHFIAAQIQEAQAEAVAEIANKQALIHGESVMLNGKLVTNEELYKQPTDYVKEAYVQGFNDARDMAEGIVNDWDRVRAQRIGELKP